MKKLLIVGAGGIGKKHIDGFLRTKKFDISVCDVNKRKIEKVRKNFVIRETYENFNEVALKKFNAVLIATPANFHIPIAIKCAKNKVPFLVEKPLSVNLKGVNKLISLVKKNKIPCGVGFTRRSIPSFIKLKEFLESGIIDKVKMAIFYVAQDYRKYRPDYHKIYFSKKEMGGGCILDTISHFVDLSQWYIGKPGEVNCLYDNLLFGKKVETEDSAILISKFGNCLVNFYCNLFQKPCEILIEFAGTKGNLKYISENKFLSKILFCDNDDGKWKEISRFENEISNFYFYQAQNFLNLLKGKENTLTTVEESFENLKFCLKG